MSVKIYFAFYVFTNSSNVKDSHILIVNHFGFLKDTLDQT